MRELPIIASITGASFFIGGAVLDHAITLVAGCALLCLAILLSAGRGGNE